jgi:feruloyl-CoA synthase
MDGSSPNTAPFRDARYAPRALEVERRGEALILRNPMPYSDVVQTVTAPLARWAVEAPDRVWLAEREGEGWRTITFADAKTKIEALAGGLKALGLGPDRPLLILARNGIDHALIGYAAMSLGAPIAPVSPQYGLKGAELSRLAFAVERLKPAAVYVDDAAAFADALAAPFLAGLPVVASRNPRARDIPFETCWTPRRSRLCRPGDVAKLLLTSGSTGKPKAVICTHANIALNAAQIAACYEDPDPPVLVNSAPWSHSLGANAILHMVLHRGGTLYIDAGQPLAGALRRDDPQPARGVADLSQHGPGRLGPAGRRTGARRGPGGKFFEKVRVLQYGGASMAQSILDRVQAVAAADDRRAG